MHFFCIENNFSLLQSLLLLWQWRFFFSFPAVQKAAGSPRCGRWLNVSLSAHLLNCSSSNLPFHSVFVYAPCFSISLFISLFLLHEENDNEQCWIHFQILRLWVGSVPSIRSIGAESIIKINDSRVCKYLCVPPIMQIIGHKIIKSLQVNIQFSFIWLCAEFSANKYILWSIFVSIYKVRIAIIASAEQPPSVKVTIIWSFKP